ncbi:MAG TPA: 30S ribosomal protein S18 [Candidatus Limnocylindria bacterium]|nr:30S ribosomal protein S18 [Candidatus Limnocylindria bacterium]
MTKKIKLKISSRLLKRKSRKQSYGAKRCRFCADAKQIGLMDYKNATFLRSFLTERGKILPSRISGNCARHQRKLSGMIKRSRTMALLPYISPWM